MVLVLKEVLRRKGLNDPFKGGLSSYGLVLMVTFLLLKQRKLLNRTNEEGDKSRTASGEHTSPHHHPSPGGADKKGMLKPLNQSTFGISAGKTILRQAGLGLEGEGGGSKWDDTWDEEDDPLFGFTFFIQHQEFQSSDEEDSVSGTDDEEDEVKAGAKDGWSEATARATYRLPI